MESIKIENLLDKYFEAKTTIEEEKELHNYFTQEDIPSHLQDYKAMFSFFAKNKLETSNKPVQIKNIQSPKNYKKRFNWLQISAAIILLIATIYFIKPTKISEKEQKQAQTALIESQKAFQLISKNLNKGNKAIAYLKDYEAAKNKIFK